MSVRGVDAGDLIIVATIGGPAPARYVRALRGSRNQHVGFHQVRIVYPDGHEGAPRRFHQDDIKKARVCRECGCSDYFACEGGCSWTERDLCSSCA